jgi:hypothetical protein
MEHAWLQVYVVAWLSSFSYWTSAQLARHSSVIVEAFQGFLRFSFGSVEFCRNFFFFVRVMFRTFSRTAARQLKQKTAAGAFATPAFHGRSASFLANNLRQACAEGIGARRTAFVCLETQTARLTTAQGPFYASFHVFHASVC